MKNNYLLLLAVLTLIIFCSGTSDSDEGFPLNTQDMMERYDYFISLGETHYYSIYPQRSDMAISLYSRIIPGEFELKIGNNDFSDLEWHYSNHYEMWHISTALDKDSLTIDENNYISYQIDFNGDFHQNTIKLAPTLSCNYTEEYCFGEDWELTWTTDNEPELYNIQLSYYYSSTQGSQRNYKEEQLSSNATSYSVDKAFFNDDDYSGGYRDFHVDLYSINYSQVHKFMIYSYDRSNISYDNMIDL